jgi:type II secretory pathway pseudopilin PulG
MSRQSGFTLVEALTASVISTVVAGAILTVLFMTTNQVRDGSALSRLTQQQTVVSEQIRTSARKAWFVKKTTAEGMPILSTEPADAGRHEVAFADSNGTVFAAYFLDPAKTYLQEWIGGAYVPFKVGEDTVFVDYPTSSFGILSQRKGVTFQLGYNRTFGGKNYTFPLLTETVYCRNYTL